MHTWTSAEKVAAIAFVRSLPEERIDAGRQRMRMPSATVMELIEALSTDKEELTRLQFVFRFNRDQIIQFFRQQAPLTDLHLTRLTNGTAEELWAWLVSYFTQRWAGNVQELLNQRGRDRLENDGGLRREWERMRESTFNARSREQVEVFLSRMTIDQLNMIRQKLTREVDAMADKAALVQAILAAAEGPRGPYQLLKAMQVHDVRVFMEQHWRQIEQLNNPEASGYGDRITFDMHTCYLFILWAWAHM